MKNPHGWELGAAPGQFIRTHLQCPVGETLEVTVTVNRNKGSGLRREARVSNEAGGVSRGGRTAAGVLGGSLGPASDSWVSTWVVISGSRD